MARVASPTRMVQQRGRDSWSESPRPGRWLAEGAHRRLRTGLTRCTFSYFTVAGWVNRPPEDQLAYLREEQRSLRASGPGGSVGPGACPWLAASARPVAACATIAGRLAPVGLDASRGAQPGGVRRPPPPVRGRKPGVRWSGPLRPVARGGGAARCARRRCRPGARARGAPAPAAPDTQRAGRRRRAVPAR